MILRLSGQVQPQSILALSLCEAQMSAQVPEQKKCYLWLLHSSHEKPVVVLYTAVLVGDSSQTWAQVANFAKNIDFLKTAGRRFPRKSRSPMVKAHGFAPRRWAQDAGIS